MAGIKSLAKDTAIYGMSSIIGKFLNWCLTPLYTYLLVPAEYGIVVYLYAWIGTMLVLLTYGLETGFFRYANDSSKGDPQTVYSTCMTSLGITTCLFLILVFSFLSPISGALQYGQHQDYIGMIAIIIALDVFSALPFAYLRYRLRPLRFAFLKLLNIALTIIFNLFFLVVCPVIYKNHPDLISWFYRPDYGAGYILVSNVIASFVLLLLLTPEIFRIRWHFDWRLLKEILHYSFPLLILGLAGIMNQNLDKILYPYLLSDPQVAADQLGIYGANVKIAVVMIMFTQAFRYAYEPFIFAKTKGEDKRTTYAMAMKYFVIVDLLIFLGVMFYLDIIRYFIDPRYFVGLRVVPIIMLAELFSGIFFNLSLWYKLTDRTQWGVFFFDRSGHYRGPQRSVRTEIRLYRMCLGCFCLLFCDDVSLLAGGAKILSHPLRSEIHRKIFAFGFGAIWHCRQCPYRKHVAAFGVPDHPVIYLSDLSDQARPAVESDSLSQQTDF